MKLTLLQSPTEDDWMLVKKCALVTVGLDAKTKPTEWWKHHILEARHSPIRELKFVFYMQDVPYCTSVHLVRHHEGCQPYVRSQRNDRQDAYDRNAARQDAPVNMIWSINAEALMVIANKRLCAKADATTRQVIRQICEMVEDNYPEFRGLLVPMCEYHGGVCHEIAGCGMCRKAGETNA